jgi:glycine/D-amino acid oxidase-like deaminating enzyme
VLVLEKGQYPSGASVKNAGFACFGSPSELLADIEKEGRDAALARVQMRWQGLQELRQELGDEAIGLEPTGGHEIYAPDDPLYTRVAGKFDELNMLLEPIVGTKPFRHADEMIQTFGLSGVDHMIRTELEASIDSGKLMRSLLQKVISEGVIFRPGFSVEAIDETSEGVSIRSENGEKIMADRVVLAINGYTRKLFPELDVIPARGQVLLTSNIPGLQLKGTFHFKEGFYYFRDLDGAVLLGGGRELDIAGETTMDDGSSPLIQQALERMLKEVILPGREFTIEKRWSGVMAFGALSKTPLVERLSDRMVIAARLGGMGVAIGIKVAHKAAGLL